jgi:hypothetical protein
VKISQHPLIFPATMKRKRGAPKALADADNAVFRIPDVEPEKPEAEPEDPAAAEWSAFAQDHYERAWLALCPCAELTVAAVVEQLPLSLHRSFSLLRELDDLAQGVCPTCKFVLG